MMMKRIECEGVGDNDGFFECDAPSESTLNDVLCEPWPLKDVLSKLVEAANILLNDHDYDGHGWEQINAARDKAIEIIST